LQTEAGKCDHGAQSEDQLRDGLIAGIQLPKIQQKLLLGSEQKFQTIGKMCEQYEDVKHVTKTDEAVSLNYSKQNNSGMHPDNKFKPRTNVRAPTPSIPLISPPVFGSATTPLATLNIGYVIPSVTTNGKYVYSCKGLHTPGVLQERIPGHALTVDKSSKFSRFPKRMDFRCVQTNFESNYRPIIKAPPTHDNLIQRILTTRHTHNCIHYRLPSLRIYCGPYRLPWLLMVIAGPVSTCNAEYEVSTRLSSPTRLPKTDRHAQNRTRRCLPWLPIRYSATICTIEHSEVKAKEGVYMYQPQTKWYRLELWDPSNTCVIIRAPMDAGGNEDVLSGQVLFVKSTRYPAILGLETQFAIIHPTWSVIYIPRDSQTDQKNTCDLTLASSYLCKFPWPTQKPRCSQNCTSQPDHLKHDVRYGAVQKPKYGSAMMARHCHTQFDGTPATNPFQLSTVPFRPLGPLPAITNKLMLNSEFVNEHYYYLKLCECRVHTKGRDDFGQLTQKQLHLFLLFEDENDVCMLHIDKAFLSYLRTGVQKKLTAVSLHCLSYSNETPCALDGPKNTLNARRSHIVTIPWRIVTIITTLNDSPKMFMYGAVHGPKYGVAMTDSVSSSPMISMNGLSSNEVAARIKYLGLNVSTQLNAASNPGSVFFNEDRSRTNLIINYLPQSYDQNDLQRLFERVGPIRQCKLIRDKNTGASLCYGFVDFVNPQHAALAIQMYHGYETEQKRLRVAYASSGGRRFTPSHRLPSVANTVGAAGCLTNEVTNENVIGWEVFVVGIPMEWTEADLLRLFNNFGNVILVRLLAPQLSESPPSHKARMSSPALNGAASDMSSESADGSRLTTTASVIFEERSSAEQSVFRLNGYHAPEWSSPLRLRIIGSVTRETYGLFCLPSRQSPAFGLSRLPNSQNSAEHFESDVLSNLLNRKALGSSNCLPNVTFNRHFSSSAGNNSQQRLVVLTLIDALLYNAQVGFMFNTFLRSVLGDGQSILNPQGNPLELLELLDGQVASNTSNLMGGNERFASRDLSLVNALAVHRASEQEASRLEHSLRGLTANQSHTWTFPHRSALASGSDAARGADSIASGLLSNTVKRLSIKTPVIASTVLSSMSSQRGCQVNVWLKLENLQPTGSFKVRGMENVCRKWAASGVTHVVCPSGCNAAVAAGFCAQAYGLTCTVVIPEPVENTVRRRLAIDAPDTKVVVHGSDWLEANHRAEQLVNDLQAGHPGDSSIRLLHPYDHPDLWEGYEVIVDELAPDVGQPDVIILAVGGGGLLAGIIQGLWNRGWSSTHVVAVETEGADCLSRSMKAGQLLLVPRVNSIASSLIAPVLAHRSWNLAQLQSLTPVICTDLEALDAVKRFLDDHGMLVEPACGAALSAVYSGVLGRLQLEGRIPRPANVVVLVGGGRNVSLRQIPEWEAQLSMFSNDHLTTSFIPPMTNPYLSHTSPRTTVCSDVSIKQSVGFGQQLSQDADETLKLNSSTPSTPRAVCTILNRNGTTAPESADLTQNASERDGSGECSGTLNPHDLVNFSKLLASDADPVDAGGLRE
ncbi:serine dehydratase-like, partial [Clonorchis sinensis]